MRVYREAGVMFGWNKKLMVAAEREFSILSESAGMDNRLRKSAERLSNLLRAMAGKK